MLFFETSAKTSLNIDEVLFTVTQAFTKSAKEISLKIEEGKYDLSNEVGL